MQVWLQRTVGCIALSSLVFFGANDDVGYQLHCERCLYEYVRGCIGLDPLLVLFLSKHLQLFFR